MGGLRGLPGRVRLRECDLYRVRLRFCDLYRGGGGLRGLPGRVRLRICEPYRVRLRKSAPYPPVYQSTAAEESIQLARKSP